MTPKEEFLQKVRKLVEWFTPQYAVDNLVGKIGELIGEASVEYGIFNLLADGWALDLDAEMLQRLRVDEAFGALEHPTKLDSQLYLEQVATRKPLKQVTDDKKWLFEAPIRTMGSRKAALLIIRELRLRREFLLDRERGGTYAGVGDLELRRRVTLATEWEKDEGDDL